MRDQFRCYSYSYSSSSLTNSTENQVSSSALGFGTILSIDCREHGPISGSPKKLLVTRSAAQCFSFFFLAVMFTFKNLKT